VRLLKNDFFNRVQQAEKNGASTEELQELLGRGRAKLGMFEGNLTEGELEIGQVSALIKSIKPAAEIVQEMYKEYEAALKQPVK
ncbi:MAG: nitronate monooxygenase, partial [Ferruginibacter sp.]